MRSAPFTRWQPTATSNTTQVIFLPLSSSKTPPPTSCTQRLNSKLNTKILPVHATHFTRLCHRYTANPFYTNFPKNSLSLLRGRDDVLVSSRRGLPRVCVSHDVPTSLDNFHLFYFSRFALLSHGPVCVTSADLSAVLLPGRWCYVVSEINMKNARNAGANTSPKCSTVHH